MFNETLLDHFQNPRFAGELQGATTHVEVSNPVCGDVLQFSAKVIDGRTLDVRFLCRGCTTAIACASMAAEKMHGVELSALQKFNAEVIAQAFGGLPAATYHGAELAADGIRALLAAVEKSL